MFIQSYEIAFGAIVQDAKKLIIVIYQYSN